MCGVVEIEAVVDSRSLFSLNISEYLSSLVKKEKKVNTTGLFCYEIINNVYKNNFKEDILIDQMWQQQKDV